MTYTDGAACTVRIMAFVKMRRRMMGSVHLQQGNGSTQVKGHEEDYLLPK